MISSIRRVVQNKKETESIPHRLSKMPISKHAIIFHGRFQPILRIPAHLFTEAQGFPIDSTPGPTLNQNPEKSNSILREISVMRLAIKSQIPPLPPKIAKLAKWSLPINGNVFICSRYAGQARFSTTPRHHRHRWTFQ